MAHSPDAVTIVQWRPAMDLQALCRVGRIPYHVINSRYPLFISTGGLPQVRCGAVALGPQSFEWIQKVSPRVTTAVRDRAPFLVIF